MIVHWGDWLSRRGKSKKKMVYYCMQVWGGKQIRRDHLYWPIFGSFEDWICQALNIYVNSKEPFSLEESEYAFKERNVLHASPQSSNLSRYLCCAVHPNIKVIIHNPTASYLMSAEFLTCIICINYAWFSYQMESMPHFQRKCLLTETAKGSDRLS